MVFQGKFLPKNLDKYDGDSSNIIYRSSWELATFIWCDNNPFIKKYSSEETVIPYRCLFCEQGKCLKEKKYHRYFPDLKIEFINKGIYLIEIKPSVQLLRPQKGKKQQKTFLKEINTYVKNTSKWKAAQLFAQQKNWKFQVWTEHTLKSLGIKLLK